MNPFTMIFAFVGVGCITWGAAWIYHPLGPIVCGMMMLSAAFMSVRKK